MRKRGMLRLGCAIAALSVWVLGACGDDAASSETDALVDTLVALSVEEDGLECDCFFEPDSCPPEQPTQAEVACVKSVVSAHADEFLPELECEIREREHENDCLMQTCEVEPLEACWDAFTEDCDDVAGEAYEDEIDACAPPRD